MRTRQAVTCSCKVQGTISQAILSLVIRSIGLLETTSSKRSPNSQLAKRIRTIERRSWKKTLFQNRIRRFDLIRLMKWTTNKIKLSRKSSETVRIYSVAPMRRRESPIVWALRFSKEAKRTKRLLLRTKIRAVCLSWSVSARAWTSMKNSIESRSVPYTSVDCLGSVKRSLQSPLILHVVTAHYGSVLRRIMKEKWPWRTRLPSYCDVLSTHF